MANHELQGMHSKQAKLLTRLLDTADRAMNMLDRAKESESPDEMLACVELIKATTSPALLTVVNNFLKQNDITALNDDVVDLSETEKLLQGKRRRFLGSVPTVDMEDMQ